MCGHLCANTTPVSRGGGVSLGGGEGRGEDAVGNTQIAPSVAAVAIQGELMQLATQFTNLLINFHSQYFMGAMNVAKSNLT